VDELLFDNVTVSSERFPAARVYITGPSRRKLECFLHDTVAPFVEGIISEVTFAKDQGVTVRCMGGATGTRTKIITYTFSTSSDVYKDVVEKLKEFRVGMPA